VNDRASWLRYGVNHDLQILVIEPLFEEANRCRKLVADTMRALDALGIGSRLADLPGTGESPIGIADVRIADWRDAIQGYAPALVASFRGGALVDEAASVGVWRFAPETGIRVVRDLKRAALASSDSALYGGHALGDAFLAELEAATPFPLTRLRTVRLDSDAGEADAKVRGSPLWRRAEPGEDSELAATLAADLADWAKQCAGS
jgi:hypothetical protein